MGKLLKKGGLKKGMVELVIRVWGGFVYVFNVITNVFMFKLFFIILLLILFLVYKAFDFGIKKV